MQTIVFDGNKIALVVCGKIGIDHEPDLLAQHADVILVDGTPDNLYKQIIALRKDVTSYSGHIGIIKKPVGRRV